MNYQNVVLIDLLIRDRQRDLAWDRRPQPIGLNPFDALAKRDPGREPRSRSGEPMSVGRLLRRLRPAGA